MDLIDSNSDSNVQLYMIDQRLKKMCVITIHHHKRETRQGNQSEDKGVSYFSENKKPHFHFIE